MILLFFGLQDIPSQHNSNTKQKVDSKNVNKPEEKNNAGKPQPDLDADDEEDEEDAEAMVEEEESEFSHFEDDEEFENYRPVRHLVVHKLCLTGNVSLFFKKRHLIPKIIRYIQMIILLG